MNITRTESGEVIQVGSVTRVVHGQAASEVMQAPPESARVNTGPVRWSASTGAQSVGVARYQVGAEAPRSGSVMATLQRQNGMATVELEPGNPSSRTIISTALRDGIVRETFPGIYEDMAAPATGPQQQSEQETAEPPGEASLFDQREAAIWQEEIAPLSQASYDSAVAGTVAAVVTGEGDIEGVARRLAEANGMQPEQALEFVETGIEWHQRTLTNDLAKQGLVTQDNAQAFYDSLHGNPRLTEAMQQLAFEGRSDVFQELALGWKRTAAQATATSLREQLARHGMEVTVDHATGELMTQRPGGKWVALSELASFSSAQAAPTLPAGIKEQLAQIGMEVMTDPATGELMTRSHGGRWVALSKMA